MGHPQGLNLSDFFGLANFFKIPHLVSTNKIILPKHLLIKHFFHSKIFLHQKFLLTKIFLTKICLTQQKKFHQKLCSDPKFIGSISFDPGLVHGYGETQSGTIHGLRESHSWLW